MILTGFRRGVLPKLFFFAQFWRSTSRFCMKLWSRFYLVASCIHKRSFPAFFSNFYINCGVSLPDIIGLSVSARRWTDLIPAWNFFLVLSDSPLRQWNERGGRALSIFKGEYHLNMKHIWVFHGFPIQSEAGFRAFQNIRRLFPSPDDVPLTFHPGWVTRLPDVRQQTGRISVRSCGSAAIDAAGGWKVG